MVIMTRIKIVEKITKLKIKPLKKAHWKSAKTSRSGFYVPGVVL
jgi:hypothetical protein